MSCDDLHRDLVLYANGLPPPGSGRLAYLRPRRTFFVSHAEERARAFRSRDGTPIGSAGEAFAIEVEPYRGKNRHVLEMMRYLEQNLTEDLAGAFVHGSLATGEEIPYSDFDALAILKDEVCRDGRRMAEAGKRLYGALRIMLDRDPLQHHGWFILAERHFEGWPEQYLPVEAVKCAKSLFSGGRSLLQGTVMREPGIFRRSLEAMAGSIAVRTGERKFPGNLYRLKKVLSAFMLLPALYVQRRDGRGVFKKVSFDMAREDITAREWSIMEEVSTVRRDWSFAPTPLHHAILTNPSPLGRWIAERYAPAVPEELKRWLTSGASQRMRALALLFAEKGGQ